MGDTLKVSMQVQEMTASATFDRVEKSGIARRFVGCLAVGGAAASDGIRNCELQPTLYHQLHEVWVGA